MTPRQNQGAGKHRPPAIPLDYYDSSAEKRNTNLFFVFYNGEVTESQYFKSLSDDLAGKGNIRSQFLHLAFVHGSPEQVVQAALNDVNCHRREYSANSDDVIWVVFDKDDFEENYSEAISVARQENISVAYSNECFELWLLLHFQEQKTPIGRTDLTELLRRKLEDITGKPIDRKSMVKHFPYSILRKHGDRDSAIAYAKMLHKQAEIKSPDSPWDINPVSTVYNLVEELVRFFTVK